MPVPAMYRAILICQGGMGVRTDIVVGMEGVRCGWRVLGGAWSVLGEAWRVLGRNGGC